MEKMVKLSQVPAFFKVFLPGSSSQKMKLPPAFVKKIPQGSIPRKLFLRNRCGRLWTVLLGSMGENLFFQGVGWVQFVRENNLVEGHFLMFYFNGTETFDFKIFEHNRCEKIDEDEAKVEVEDDINEAEEATDEDGVAEEGGDKLEANADKDNETTPVGMQDEEEAGENPGKRKRDGKKKAKGEVIDIYGADIFKSGRYIQPENPYFVTKLRRDKRDQLYIPVDLIKDLEYDLPETLKVCDPRGKTYCLQINDWNDGRIWYKDGWSRLCHNFRIFSQKKKKDGISPSSSRIEAVVKSLSHIILLICWSLFSHYRVKMVEFHSQNEVIETKTKKPNIGEFRKSTTLASMESLSMPEVHEVVFLADFRCSKCQERVAEVMSKMNGDMQSVVVSVREKEVTLTCTNSRYNYASSNKMSSLYNKRSSSSTKLAFIMRLFFSNRNTSTNFRNN
ncbi:hypothetical protein Leryth_020615 [Lithospermum erythrorhizon]|nr:hypothetical protein Leryth_020615 [Lithospermum erythrorhizon]